MRQSLTISFWNANPISRPALGFVCGLIISLIYDISHYDLLLALAIGSASLSILFNHSRSALNSKYSLLAGITLFVTFVLLGVASFGFAKVEASNGKFYPSQLNQSHFAIIKVSGNVNHKSNHKASFDASLLQLKTDGKWKLTSIKLKCNVKDAPDNYFKKGEVLFINGYFYLPPFSHPDSLFDYRTWLLDSHFGAIVNLFPEQILKIQDLGIFDKSIQNIRQTLGNYYSKSSYSEVSISLAKALLLGQKSSLDSNTKENFSNSGIIHILAVSGLHVGLIYVGLSYLLNLISWVRRHRAVKACILITILWVYAAVTGFSPSVCRASLMLTIATIALSLNLNNLPFNALFSAALLMLIINPFEIISLSFLLSFSAVYGILSVSPALNKLSQSSGFFIKWIAISLLISTSAQLATLPFTLYAFGQFPNYFMLANLLAIPLATIITCTGFLALLLQFIPYLGDIFLFISMFSIEILEKWSAFISNLPHAIAEIPELTMSSAIWIGLTSFILFTLPKIGLKLSILTSLCFITVVQLTDNRTHSSKQYLYWHKTNDGAVLTCFSEKSKNNSFKFYLKEDQKISLHYFRDVAIIYLNDSVLPPKVPLNLPCVIIFGNKSHDVSRSWIELLKPNLVLFSNRINNRRMQALINECASFNIPVWNHWICNRLEIAD